MDDDIVERSIIWAKENQKKLIGDFCSTDKYPPVLSPITVFLAGSPGSGKTEFSKALVKQLEIKFIDQKFIHLDIDCFREIIPGYTGHNSDQVQRASTIIFDKIFDHILHSDQNAVIDTTFASPRSSGNIDRSLNHDRQVGITYLYQDPFIAWDFTKKREKLEGRSVPKDVFINAYFKSKENVEAAKLRYGSKITLDLYIKDEDNSYQRAHFNINSLSGYLKEEYSSEYLQQNLPD